MSSSPLEEVRQCTPFGDREPLTDKVRLQWSLPFAHFKHHTTHPSAVPFPHLQDQVTPSLSAMSCGPVTEDLTAQNMTERDGSDTGSDASSVAGQDHDAESTTADTDSESIHDDVIPQEYLEYATFMRVSTDDPSSRTPLTLLSSSNSGRASRCTSGALVQPFVAWHEPLVSLPESSTSPCKPMAIESSCRGQPGGAWTAESCRQCWPSSMYLALTDIG